MWQVALGNMLPIVAKNEPLFDQLSNVRRIIFKAKVFQQQSNLLAERQCGVMPFLKDIRGKWTQIVQTGVWTRFADSIVRASNRQTTHTGLSEQSDL